MLEEFHTNKKHLNLLSTCTKKTKQAYDKYFERNWKNIKNTWKGIINLLFLEEL